MNNTTDFEDVLGKKNANIGKAIVNSKTELGYRFKETLTDTYNKFSEWLTTRRTILEAFRNAKEAIEIIKEIDDSKVELKK